MHNVKFGYYSYIYMKKIRHYVIDFAGKFLLREIVDKSQRNIRSTLAKFSVKKHYKRSLVIIFYGVLVSIHRKEVKVGHFSRMSVFPNSFDSS